MLDMDIKLGARKAFREFLNNQPQLQKHVHNRFHQKTRPYGDYLYHQDRDKFNYEFDMAMHGLCHGFDQTVWIKR